MAPVWSGLGFVLALVISTEAATSAPNASTCSAGLRAVSCWGGDFALEESRETRCVVPCDTNAEFKENPCEPADICYPCRQSKWCDGLGYSDCPSGMASPRGSTSEGDCFCHRGHVQDGATCTVCPEGSWCDGSGAQSCPSGMTSNRASVAQEDCFCPEGYTGGLDCAGRENATHHRCNPGYYFQGVDNTIPGASFDKCEVGPSNFWCDGTVCLGCPTEDQGVSYEYGKTSYAECFCPFGYTTLVDQGPCVPCPPDGVQNASKQLWTRGVNCAVTNMSVVSFIATLAVSVDEFNAKRGEFAMGVAQALWVPFGTVAVGQASEAAAGQRRLLAPASVAVTSAVTVPTEDAAFVAAATTPENLARALGARALTVAAVSAPGLAVALHPAALHPDPTPAAEPDVDPPPNADDDTMGMVAAVAVSASVLLLLGAMVAWCSLKTRKPSGYARF